MRGTSMNDWSTLCVGLLVCWLFFFVGGVVCLFVFAGILSVQDMRNIQVRYMTLQHTTTHCNTLQHTATHCNTLRARDMLLQHTAIHCRYAPSHVWYDSFAENKCLCVCTCVCVCACVCICVCVIRMCSTSWITSTAHKKWFLIYTIFLLSNIHKI